MLSQQSDAEWFSAHRRVDSTLLLRSGWFSISTRVTRSVIHRSMSRLLESEELMQRDAFDYKKKKKKKEATPLTPPSALNMTK